MVCVNKPFLSFNNPDPMDQILALHRVEEMVCVFKDPFEVKLSFTQAVSNSSFPCLTGSSIASSQCCSIALLSQVFATLLHLIYRLDF